MSTGKKKYTAKRSTKSFLSVKNSANDDGSKVLGVSGALTLNGLDTTITEKPTLKSQGKSYAPPMPTTTTTVPESTTTNKPAAVISEELKRDIAVIKMRNYLDPKKFYKSADAFGPHAQLGTIIEGPTEYYSGRLTKKERRTTVLDEFRSEDKIRKYTKKSFFKIQKSKPHRRDKKFIKSSKNKVFK